VNILIRSIPIVESLFLPTVGGVLVAIVGFCLALRFFALDLWLALEIGEYTAAIVAGLIMSALAGSCGGCLPA